MMRPSSRQLARTLEILGILAAVSLFGDPFAPGGSPAGLPQGVFVHHGGFVVSALELKDGHFEIRSSDCTSTDQLDSQGTYYRSGNTLLLQARGQSAPRVLDVLPDGFKERNGDGREYIQQIREDGSRVESPREASWLGYSVPPEALYAQ